MDLFCAEREMREVPIYFRINRIWRFRLFNDWVFWKVGLGKEKRFKTFEIRTDFRNFFNIIILNFDFLFYKMRSHWT